MKTGTNENKHDLTSTVPLNYESNVENTEVRLLLKQLDWILDCYEVDLDTLNTEIKYLKDMK